MYELDYTKGEWGVGSYLENEVINRDKPYSNIPIARCYDNTMLNTGAARANAKLIAAAPKMFELLKEAHDMCLKSPTEGELREFATKSHLLLTEITK
jgi:hypothetical protein